MLKITVYVTQWDEINSSYLQVLIVVESLGSWSDSPEVNSPEII
jgi:hypothetical protein